MRLSAILLVLPTLFLAGCTGSAPEAKPAASPPPVYDSAYGGLKVVLDPPGLSAPIFLDGQEVGRGAYSTNTMNPGAYVVSFGEVQGYRKPEAVVVKVESDRVTATVGRFEFASVVALSSTPTPAPNSTPTPSPTPNATPSPTATPSPSPASTPSPSAIPTPTPAPFNRTLSIQYAKLFNVTYGSGIKVLRDGANRTLTLIPRDGPETVRGTSVVRVPVQRMVLFSSTHAAMLDRLGSSAPVVGVTWGGQFEWFIPSIKNGLASGAIKDLGPGSTPNYELLASLNPDLVVLVGGVSSFGTHAQKLEELGIPYAVNSEWLEGHPLARGEWMKFFAAFTNEEAKAERVFNEVRDRVLNVVLKVAGAQPRDVLWALMSGGIVYVPAAENYAAKAVSLAGGRYVFSDVHGTGSAQVSAEEIVNRSGNVGVWVYSSTLVNTTRDVVNTSVLFANVSALQQCNVYAFQPWYWQSLDRVDEFMQDVGAIIHPARFPGHSLLQFKRLPCP